MSSQGNVLVGKSPVGEVSGRGIVRSGKCPSGKYQSGNCSRGSVSRGAVQSGNFPHTLTLPHIPRIPQHNCKKVSDGHLEKHILNRRQEYISIAALVCFKLRK